MKTAYLYGDSTPSPLTTNFIAFLKDAIDFAVHALHCGSRIEDWKQRAARFTEITEIDVERLRALATESIALLDRATANEGDSRLGRSSAQIRQRISEVVRVEIESAQAAIATETCQAERAAASERRNIAKAIEALLLTHTWPEVVEVIEIGAENGMHYDARVRACTPFGLSWTAKIDIPTSHALAHIVRLERIMEQVEVEAPEHSGWLGKGVKLRTRRLDRLHLTELCISPAATSARLRAAVDGTGGGFDLAFAEGSPEVQIVRLPKSGPADLPYEAVSDDSAALHELHARLRAVGTDLLANTTSVVAASLDDVPLAELPTPRALLERMIMNLAPIVRQVVSRSLAPGELVLKRQVGDHQRDELFVSKASLRQKVETLSPELQQVFAPLELARAVPEPFALLDEPRQPVPITVPDAAAAVTTLTRAQPMRADHADEGTVGFMAAVGRSIGAGHPGWVRSGV
jgi:hypothetical protein